MAASNSKKSAVAQGDATTCSCPRVVQIPCLGDHWFIPSWEMPRTETSGLHKQQVGEELYTSIKLGMNMNLWKTDELPYYACC